MYPLLYPLWVIFRRNWSQSEFEQSGANLMWRYNLLRLSATAVVPPQQLLTGGL